MTAHFSYITLLFIFLIVLNIIDKLKIIIRKKVIISKLSNYKQSQVINGYFLSIMGIRQQMVFQDKQFLPIKNIPAASHNKLWLLHRNIHVKQNKLFLARPIPNIKHNTPSLARLTKPVPIHLNPFKHLPKTKNHKIELRSNPTVHT
jgi:hypothetical protein